MLPTIHLASQSPRRKQLLESLGLPFVITLATVPEEVHPGAESIQEGILRNAKTKAMSILHLLPQKSDIVLGADTLVVLGEKVLGKPKDAQEAKQMLCLLSGKAQTVYTGIYLISPHYGESGVVISSEVHFKKIPTSEMDAYIKTKEPYDKAGGYAVQGIGALFIEKIVGSYTNVVGLPIEALMVQISKLTQIPIYEWFK